MKTLVEAYQAGTSHDLEDYCKTKQTQGWEVRQLAWNSTAFYWMIVFEREN